MHTFLYFNGYFEISFTLILKFSSLVWLFEHNNNNTLIFFLLPEVLEYSTKFTKLRRAACTRVCVYTQLYLVGTHTHTY
jgi:hypothetical protein